MTTQTFSSPGTYTWTCPANVTLVDVECWGGGGGSGGTSNGYRNTSGGAAGGQYAKSTISVTPGVNYTYVVGAGGAGGASGGTASITSGANGGDSWFSTTGSAPTTAAQGALAKGGAGSQAANWGAGAAAGSGSVSGAIGSVTYRGGSGNAGFSGGNGGGGAGARRTGAGADATTSGPGIGTAGGGDGGAGIFYTSGAPGGGAGGTTPTSSTLTGATGGAGSLILTYTPSAWTSTVLPANQSWSSVAFGNGVFVAVADSSATGARSTDGVNWTSVTLPNASRWIRVAFGNGTFVAIALASAYVATSPDGVTWTLRHMGLGSAAQWSALAFGGGLFTALAGATSLSASSTDGVTWTQGSCPQAGWLSVAYNGAYPGGGGRMFVAISNDGTAKTAYTTNGAGYILATVLPSTGSWSAITYGNGLFVATKANTATFATSPDGNTWTSRTVPLSAPWNAITYGNGQFLALANGPSSACVTSSDGVNWTWVVPPDAPPSNNYDSVAYGSNKYAAVAYSTNLAATLLLPDTTAPTAPGQPSLSNQADTSVTLTWSAASDDVGVTNYVVYKDGSLYTTVGNVLTANVTGLTANTTYSFTVKAKDATGNLSPASTARTYTPTDTTAPTAPGQPSLSNQTENSVTLTWTASTDSIGVTNYQIFKDGTLYSTVGNVLTGNVTGLTVGTQYSFTVKAKDAAGNTSPASTIRTYMPVDVTAPSVPSSLQATTVTGDSIALMWTNSTDSQGVTGYEVRRNGSVVATPSSNTFTDTGLSEITQYSYDVRARDAAGNWSARTNVLAVTTLDVTSPTDPTNMKLEYAGLDSIKFSWAAPTDNVGVTAYEIYQDNVLVNTTAGHTYYNAINLHEGTSYTFKIRARDAAGNWSGFATATYTTESVVMSQAELTHTSGQGNLGVRVFEGQPNTLEHAPTDEERKLRRRPDQQ